MSSGGEPVVERMREQAERAISSSKSRNVVLPLLERLARVAPVGSEASGFAHRHLAEYLVEQHPWRALLHLRQVTRAGGPSAGGEPIEADDGAHALAGLAHALLGNYRSAVQAYRRAIAVAPRNPWYQRNLGHLLDVGLDRPKAARRHLEAAHRGAGRDDEISASLAHCLARLGELSSARAHAEAALATSPGNPEHQRLLAWIQAGAPEAAQPRRGAPGSSGGPGNDASGADGSTGEAKPPPPMSASPAVAEGPTSTSTSSSVGTAPASEDKPRRRKTPAAAVRVSALLRERMALAYGESADVERTIELWNDYWPHLKAVEIRATEPVTWAAMMDLAGAAIEGGHASGKSARNVTLAVAARRYGVKTEVLRARWALLLAHWGALPGAWAALSEQLGRRTRGPRHARS